MIERDYTLSRAGRMTPYVIKFITKVQTTFRQNRKNNNRTTRSQNNKEIDKLYQRIHSKNNSIYQDHVMKTYGYGALKTDIQVLFDEIPIILKKGTKYIIMEDAGQPINLLTLSQVRSDSIVSNLVKFIELMRNFNKEFLNLDIKRENVLINVSDDGDEITSITAIDLDDALAYNLLDRWKLIVTTLHVVPPEFLYYNRSRSKLKQIISDNVLDDDELDKLSLGKLSEIYDTHYAEMLLENSDDKLSLFDLKSVDQTDKIKLTEILTALVPDYEKNRQIKYEIIKPETRQLFNKKSCYNGILDVIISMISRGGLRFYDIVLYSIKNLYISEVAITKFIQPLWKDTRGSHKTEISMIVYFSLMCDKNFFLKNLQCKSFEDGHIIHYLDVSLGDSYVALDIDVAIFGPDCALQLQTHKDLDTKKINNFYASCHKKLIESVECELTNLVSNTSLSKLFCKMSRYSPENRPDYAEIIDVVSKTKLK